jgi:uncharacterized protein YndB with AHSA1/START domain
MNTTIIVQAKINANSKQVWECYTQPKHITKWNFASDEWYCPSAENDLRVGGKMVSRMEAKDGSFGFDFEGFYDEVIDLKKLSYAMPDGRKVVTTFSEENGSTQVVSEFEVEDQNTLAQQKDGWQAILNNFKGYVEKDSE